MIQVIWWLYQDTSGIWTRILTLILSWGGYTIINVDMFKIFIRGVQKIKRLDSISAHYTLFFIRTFDNDWGSEVFRLLIFEFILIYIILVLSSNTVLQSFKEQYLRFEREWFELHYKVDSRGQSQQIYPQDGWK